MEEKNEEVEDVGSASGDSFIDESEDDGPSTSGQDEQLHLEASHISFSICIWEALVSLVALRCDSQDSVDTWVLISVSILLSEVWYVCFAFVH